MGMEDCLIFDELMTQHNSNLMKVLEEFSRVRQPDGLAICELALYNYIEMRHLVNSRWFRVRKMVDSFLHATLPRTWVPLYTTVTFTRTPYRLCITNKEWQDRMLNRTLCFSGVVAAVAAICSWKGIVFGGEASPMGAMHALFPSTF